MNELISKIQDKLLYLKIDIEYLKHHKPVPPGPDPPDPPVDKYVLYLINNDTIIYEQEYNDVIDQITIDLNNILSDIKRIDDGSKLYFNVILNDSVIVKYFKITKIEDYFFSVDNIDNKINIGNLSGDVIFHIEETDDINEVEITAINIIHILQLNENNINNYVGSIEEDTIMNYFLNINELKNSNDYDIVDKIIKDDVYCLSVQDNICSGIGVDGGGTNKVVDIDISNTDNFMARQPFMFITYDTKNKNMFSFNKIKTLSGTFIAEWNDKFYHFIHRDINKDINDRAYRVNINFSTTAVLNYGKIYCKDTFKYDNCAFTLCENIKTDKEYLFLDFDVLKFVDHNEPYETVIDGKKQYVSDPISYHPLFFRYVDFDNINLINNNDEIVNLSLLDTSTVKFNSYAAFPKSQLMKSVVCDEDGDMLTYMNELTNYYTIKKDSNKSYNNMDNIIDHSVIGIYNKRHYDQTIKVQIKSVNGEEVVMNDKGQLIVYPVISARLPIEYDFDITGDEVLPVYFNRTITIFVERNLNDQLIKEKHYYNYNSNQETYYEFKIDNGETPIIDNVKIYAWLVSKNAKVNGLIYKFNDTDTTYYQQTIFNSTQFPIDKNATKLTLCIRFDINTSPTNTTYYEFINKSYGTKVVEPLPPIEKEIIKPPSMSRLINRDPIMIPVDEEDIE